MTWYWLAAVVTLAAGVELLTVPALPRHRPRDASRAVIFVFTGAVCGVLVVEDTAIWTVPTVLAAAGAVCHTARLRRSTTHTHQEEPSDGS